MDKKEESITNDSLVADALIRIKTVENMLISKGLFTREEYNLEMREVVRTIAENILKNSNVSGNLKELVENMLTKKDSN